MTLQKVGPRALVGPTELSALYPEISTLPEDRRIAVAAALGQITAPCAPCADKHDLRLSECALRQEKGCENLPYLVRRVIRAAETVGDPARLRLLAVRGDVWVPDVAPLGDGAPVPVELWLDLDNALLGRTLDTLDALEQGPVPIQVTLRAYAAPGESGTLARAAGRARAAGKLREVARCVAAEDPDHCGGATLAAWSKTTDDVSDADQTVQDQALAQQRGVRSAPTWFIRGYRMRGLQSLSALQAMIAREAWAPGEPIP